MIKYRWKELDLVSIQTVSNIISFIQWAIIPIDTLNSQSQSKLGKIKQIISQRVSKIIDCFCSPLDFIKQYNQIVCPIRAMLSYILVFSFLIFMFNIFFLPSWHFFIFFGDLFIPASFIYEIFYVFYSQKFNERKTISMSLIIFGILYFVFRIIYLIYPIIKRKKIRWVEKTATTITSIYLSRLKKDKSKEEIDEIIQQTEEEIDDHEYTIQFDENHFTYKKKIIDISITISIFIIFLIFIIVGWKRILTNSYKGEQLKDLSFVCDIITYALFCGICLRLLINILWIVFKNEFLLNKVFNILKNIAYKGIYFLSGISMIPLARTALKSISTSRITCDYFQYYDSRANTPSFLQYFMEKNESLCVNCTKESISVSPCNDICFYDPNKSPLIYGIMMYSPHLSLDEGFLYFTQISVNILFYLGIFNFFLLLIYMSCLKIITLLPSPTINIECKFQTLINNLSAVPLNLFRSYKYCTSLYHFSFNQSKLLTVLSILAYYRIAGSVNYKFEVFILSGILFLFSFVSFFAAASHFLTSPYISILHNIVNVVSFTLSGIISFLIGLHYDKFIELPSYAGNIFIALIIDTPILTALVIPFFAKKDPFLVPTSFKLRQIDKWDRKLNKVFKFRQEQSKALRERNNMNIKDISEDENFNFKEDGILFEEEPSISVSYYDEKKPKSDDDENEQDEDYLIGKFDLIKLAPIQVQERIGKVEYDKDGNIKDEYKIYREKIHEIWCKKDIDEENFNKATEEMKKISDKLMNCISFNNLILLLHLSIIFTSILFGWSLFEGIERWNQIHGPSGYKYYFPCNMLPNGTYPQYGTY